MEERIGYELKRAQHALRLAMDQALRQLRLTTPQYAALVSLEQERGLSSAELARRSFVTPQTMSAIVANLEQRRLVERGPRSDHGRILDTRLTARGAKLVAAAHDRVRAIETEMASGLSGRERSRFVRMLRSCREELEARAL